MAWRIEYSARAQKALKKMDRQNAARILKAVEDIAARTDPRQRGKALAGEFARLWRYRIGDWRVIARIEDGRGRVVILILAVGHRREVYR